MSAVYINSNLTKKDIIEKIKKHGERKHGRVSNSL